MALITDNIPGVDIITGFNLHANLPLDLRTIVDKRTDLDNLIKYKGMIVYVISECKSYQYVEIGGEGSNNWGWSAMDTGVISDDQTYDSTKHKEYLDNSKDPVTPKFVQGAINYAIKQAIAQIIPNPDEYEIFLVKKPTQET